MEELRYNTSIAALMELVNALRADTCTQRTLVEGLVVMLAPFAPHFAEESWERLGHATSVFGARWPEWNEALTVEDNVEVVIQVSGKTRPRVSVPRDAEQGAGVEAAQRDDDASRASHVAESVLVFVLGHLADEFGAVGAQASDGVVDAFDCKHDAPEAQGVRRCDRRFDRDQWWIAKLRQLKPPVPIWGPHHDDVDLNTFEPVDAGHPLALDRRLAFERHAERGEKSDSGCKVVDDDADVVQSLDRHVPLSLRR